MGSTPTVAEAAKIIEELTGVPPAAPVPGRKMTRGERQEQRRRLDEFASLPPELQIGCLKYARQIRDSYRSS